MGEPLDTRRLLELRSLTRRVADLLRGDLKQYLSTLMPLVRPRSLLGHYIQGAPKDPVRGSDKAFKDLQGVYETVAGARPFNLPRDLKPPLPVDSNALEFVPFEYTHAAKGRKAAKTVTVTSPLKWVLYYPGFPPEKLRESLSAGDIAGVQIQEHVLNHCLLYVALQQKGVAELFAALRFPVSAHHIPELGNLPITVVSSAIATLRPPDETIIESTEVSGSDAFEEVVDLSAIRALSDPLRERLLAAVEGETEG